MNDDVRTVARRGGAAAGLDILEYIGNRPGLERRKNMLILMEGCQNDDLCARADVFHFAGGFDTVHTRHNDIHQYHVRLQLVGQVYGLSSIVSFGNDTHLRVAVKQGSQAFPDDLVVVRQDK